MSTNQRSVTRVGTEPADILDILGTQVPYHWLLLTRNSGISSSSFPVLVFLESPFRTFLPHAVRNLRIV